MISKASSVVSSILLTMPLLAVSGCVSGEEVSSVSGLSLLREGDALFHQNEHDKALAAYLLAIKTAAGEEDDSVQAAGMSQVALIYALRSDEVRARQSLDRADELAQPGDPEGWGRYLLARGAFERDQGQTGAALQTYEELFEFSATHKLHGRAAQAAHMGTLITTGEDRVVWAKRGVETAETSGRSTWSASAWLALAWIFEDLGQNEDALQAFVTARSFAGRTSSDDAVMQADWALAHGLRMAGDLDRARELAQRTLARATTAYQFSGTDSGIGYPDYAIWVAQCQRELAELDVEEEQLESALERFVEARRYFLLAGLKERAPESLALLERRIDVVRHQAVD